MLVKSQTISARLPQKDYDFLVAFNANGASTQSEKLRELIRFVREQQDQRHSLAASVAANSKYLSDLRGKVKEIEIEEGISSEIVEIFFALLPDLNALAGQPFRFESSEQLRKLEGILILRFFQCMDRLLRLAATDSSPCYSPQALSQQLQKLRPLLDAALHTPQFQAPHVQGEQL